jgi:hypothetical protein
VDPCGSFYHGHRSDIDDPHDTEIKPWIAKACTRVTCIYKQPKAGKHKGTLNRTMKKIPMS